MRIGVIASPWVPVPPPAYGGTEAVINNLCIGLDRMGHEVHLVAVGNSTCPVRCSAVFDRPPSEIGEPSAEIVQAREAYALLREQDVDVIHDHTIIGPQFLPDSVGALPVVTTVHGPFSHHARMMYAARPAGVSIIAISYAQRAMAPEIDVDAVIHHGIDLERHGQGPGGGGYLMFVGRMSPNKGPDRAIEVARRAGLPLVLAAKMREPGEIAYFEERVRPLLGPDITFVGEADTDTRLDLLKHAEALVNPICWPEPFGLVMAESLACATPVLALRHGAAPEIVDDAVTGFLCDDLDEMVDAVDRLGDIDRNACRLAAESRFSLERMACDHTTFYRWLVDRGRRATPDSHRQQPGRTPVEASAGGVPELSLDSAVAVPAAAYAASGDIASFDSSRLRGRRRPGAGPRPLGGISSGGLLANRPTGPSEPAC